MYSMHNIVHTIHHKKHVYLCANQHKYDLHINKPAFSKNYMHNITHDIHFIVWICLSDVPYLIYS